MGTDIHCVVEEQVSPGRWVAIHIIQNYTDIWGKRVEPGALARNYRRFDALARVRGGEGLEPRGMPPDASDSTLRAFENFEGHHVSWLPLDQATRIFAETDFDLPHKVRAHLLSDETDTGRNWHFFSEEFGDGDDFRLVFWFES
jgi:hypothetical protein